jgi:hypothetical protein
MNRCAFARLVHCDWSVAPKKRWAVEALRTSSGWLVGDAKPVGPLEKFLDALTGPPQTTLAGFDFPIGLPTAYARMAGIVSFPDALADFGSGQWADFYNVCDTAFEISMRRPFYPRVSSNSARHAQLLSGLGVNDIDSLRRACERKTATRNAACALFWTLGGNQVGKAAISGWRDVLLPAMKSNARLWPFDGDLSMLSQSAGLVICETYPAEAYDHVGVRFRTGGSKRKQDDRRAATISLMQWASRRGVSFGDGMRAAIANGFGPRKSGEDPFDAAIGLLGMIEVADGRRSAGPAPSESTACEGWILGQAG